MKSALLRYGGLVVGSILLAFVAIQCIKMPLEPIWPYTDTVVAVPLLDITRTFDDLALTDTLLQKNPDGTISYRTTQYLGPQGMTDTLAAAPEPTSADVNVGRFSLDPIPPQSQSLTAATLGFPPGTYPVGFPAASASTPPLTMDFSSEIDYVQVQSGTITLRVTNTMDLPIDFPNGIRLKNNSASPLDTSEVGTFAFPGVLQKGQSATATIDLGGKLVRGAIATDSIAVHTSGVAGSFTLNPTDGLSFAFSSTTILADSAAAKIPRQQVLNSTNATFTVDDSVTIRQADFRSGSFVVAIKNGLDISVDVGVTLLDFKSTKTGASAQLLTTLNGKDSLLIPVSMDTLRIDAATPSSMGSYLQYSLGISTISSAGVKKTVTQNDLVRADFRPGKPFRIKSVTGKIKPTLLPINSSVNSKYSLGEAGSKLSGKLLFDSVRIVVRLPITGGCPADYNLTLIARNSAKNVSDSVVLPPPAGQTLRRIYPAGATVPTIVIDKSANLDSFLGKFFPDLPDQFFVRGSLLLEPPDVFQSSQYFTASDTMKVYPSVELEFPMKLGLSNGQFSTTEAVFEGGGDRIDPKMSESTKEAALNISVTNRMPIQLAMSMNFVGYDSLLHKRDTLLRVIPSGIIQASQVDPVTGYATVPTLSKVKFALTGPEIEKLNASDSVNVRLGVMTANGGTQAVRISPNDYVRIRASGNIVYTINKPK